MRAGRAWLRALEWTVAIAVLAAVARYLIRDWDRVSSRPWDVDWGLLGLASILVVLAYSGFVLYWRYLVFRLGGALSVVDAHRVWYFGNLARYVPGKVLQLAGTAYLARAKGLGPILTVGSTMAAQLFVLVAGSVLALLVLPTGTVSVPGGPAVALVAAGVLAAVLISPLFEHAYRTALRFARRSEIHVSVPAGARVGLFMGYLLAWALFGLGFALFVHAVADPPPGSLAALVGICAAGYVAGWLAVFVPGGLGVREGVYAFLLAILLPGPVAATVAILSRLWLTAVEVIVAALLAVRYGLRDLRASAATVPDSR